MTTLEWLHESHLSATFIFFKKGETEMVVFEHARMNDNRSSAVGPHAAAVGGKN